MTKIFALILLCAGVLHAEIVVLPSLSGNVSEGVVAGRLKVRLTKGVPEHLHPSVLASYGLRILYRALLPEQSVWSDTAIRPLGINKLYDLEQQLLRSYVVEFLSGEHPSIMAEKVARTCTLVECCSPVYAVTLTGIPNDSLVSQQPMLAAIRAFDAWDVEKGDSLVLIGISDSGVLQSHEDLADALHVNPAEIADNGIDDDGNGYVDDYRGYNFCTADDGTMPGNTYNSREGHGTGVAGICGAVVNNTIGIAGVANNCKMIPLKTMPDNTGWIVYGYESLVYCAVNGIKVVNCSWGSSSRSCFDEAVVAYTIERGTAIVAAAGNHGTATPFYPASYPGVLSVGVCDPSDNVIRMTGHGPTVDIMAPGQYTLTTSNNGGYGSFCCTSGSSPIVAGAVALVRSRRPDLTPVQACAVVREAAQPAPWKTIPAEIMRELLPYGRLDVLNAVTVNPDSIPSFEWDSVIITPLSPDTRWGMGDTISVALHLTNVLHECTLLNIDNIRIVGTAANALRMLSPTTITYGIPVVHSQTVTIDGITCVVERNADTTAYIVADLVTQTSAGAIHKRPLVIPVTPAPPFRNIANTVFATSVGDNARIGKVDSERGFGIGFTYKNSCGLLPECGLMITANDQVVDAVRSEKGSNNHFIPIKRFNKPKPLYGIVSDLAAPAPQRIGVEVGMNVSADTANQGILVIDITVKNISDSTLRNVGVGWFQDWDLGENPVHNSVNALLPGFSNGVLITSADSLAPSVCSYAQTPYSQATVVKAGVNNQTTYDGFTVARKQNLLRGQENAESFTMVDAACVTGVYFHDPIEPGGMRSLRQVFLVGETRSDLVRLINKAEQMHVEPEFGFFDSNIAGNPFPNPARNQFTLPIRMPETTTVTAQIHIADLQGRIVHSQQVAIHGNSLVTVNCSELSSGTYDVRVWAGQQFSHASLVIIR